MYYAFLCVWLLSLNIINVFGAHMLAFLLDIFLRIELLDHRVYICSALEEIDKLFPKAIVPIYPSIYLLFHSILGNIQYY